MNKTEMRKFFGYLKGRRMIYWTTLLSAVIVRSIMTVLTAYVNKGVFNAVELKDMDKLKTIMVYATILMIIAYLYPFTRYLHITVVRHIIYHLKVDLFKHLEHLDINYYERHHSADSIQRLSNEADSLKTAYFTEIFVVVSSFIGGVVAIITMLIYDIRLSIIVIILCITAINLSLLFTKQIRVQSNIIQAQMSKLTQLLSDCLSGFLVIKMFKGANIIINHYIDQNVVVTNARMKRTQKRALMEGINFMISILSSIGIMIIGVLMASAGHIDYGNVMAIITLQFSISNLFLNFGSSLSRLQISMSKAARVFEIFDTPKESQKYMCHKHKDENEYIQFENVDFSYESRDNVLNRVNFTVEKAKKIAFVGPSGGGKSTILKILVGFYEIKGGSIIINNNCISDYTLKELRNSIAYVPQDTYLFEETVKNNIRYGKIHASDDEIIAAAKSAYAHDFIMALPNGYNTLITAGGKNLSGGQKQRISIARAFLKNAEIILLDEATSALDTESEIQVQKGLDKLMKNKTVIIVAHRLETVEKCDAFYGVKEGNISRIKDIKTLEALYSNDLALTMR